MFPHMFVVNIYFCGSPSIKKTVEVTVTSQSQHSPSCFSILSSHLSPSLSFPSSLSIYCWNETNHLRSLWYISSLIFCLIFIWSPSIDFELVHCTIHLQRCSWRSWSRKQRRRWHTRLFLSNCSSSSSLIGLFRFSVIGKKSKLWKYTEIDVRSTVRIIFCFSY